MEREKEKKIYKERLDYLREKMREQGIDVYLVVSEDYHASEYVGDYFKCREYISGFDGSAGQLVVTSTDAGLWTDGRYFIQAKEQLEGTGISLHKMGVSGVVTIPEYLEEELKDGDCLGYDGRTLQVSYLKEIKQRLKNKNILYQENVDLVGDIWRDRPAMSHNPVWKLDEMYAGCSVTEKLTMLRKEMKTIGARYHLLASLDDIAWLYNIRGNDIRYNPVAMSYGIISDKNAILYIAPEAVDERIGEQLNKEGVEIRPYFQVYEDLNKLPAQSCLLLDESRINVALMNSISSQVEIIRKTNPTTIFKSIKNEVEIKNVRNAHLLDGVAVTRLICWLKKQYDTKAWKDGAITELSVAEKLLEFRKEQDGFLEESFAPIIATGPHGAIVHYEATVDTNLPLQDNTFVLMDTGGQYYKGTTDVTRTVSVGTLTREQKKHYTAVLRGNLNLASAYFKQGCTGVNLDYLARNPLWECGLDYNHGTGHGVGYLLNVHEGPVSIRMKSSKKGEEVLLKPGMVISDEPGVYLEGQYGIRLENLLLCKEVAHTDMGQFLAFETLTLVPFDREAILLEELTTKERDILNRYHKRVYDLLLPFLTKEEGDWLFEQTRPL